MNLYIQKIRQIVTHLIVHQYLIKDTYVEILILFFAVAKVCYYKAIKT